MNAALKAPNPPRPRGACPAAFSCRPMPTPLGGRGHADWRRGLTGYAQCKRPHWAAPCIRASNVRRVQRAFHPSQKAAPWALNSSGWFFCSAFCWTSWQIFPGLKHRPRQASAVCLRQTRRSEPAQRSPTAAAPRADPVGVPSAGYCSLGSPKACSSGGASVGTRNRSLAQAPKSSPLQRGEQNGRLGLSGP